MSPAMNAALQSRAFEVYRWLCEREPARMIPAHRTQPVACAVGGHGDNVYAERDGSVYVIARGASVSMRIDHLPAVARICERYPLPAE